MPDHAARLTAALSALIAAVILGVGTASIAADEQPAGPQPVAGEDPEEQAEAAAEESEAEEEAELRERLTEREDQRRPEDPWSVEVFGRPLTVSGEYEVVFELADQVELGAFSRKASRALVEQELEIEAFYSFGPILSLFAQGRFGYTKELASDSPDQISDWWAERGEMWLYSEGLLFPGFVFEIGRLNYEDDRRWWWDVDLDAVRVAWETDEFEIVFSTAFELGASDSSLGYVEPDHDHVLRLLGEASWDWLPDQAVELFALHHDDDSRAEKPGTLVDIDREDDSDGHLTWIGGRLMGAWAAPSGDILGYWVDGAYVWGRETLIEFEDYSRRRSIVEGSSRQDVSGWAVDAGVTWILAAPCEPRFTLAYAVGSGADDPFDGTDGSFRQTGLESNEAGFGGVRSFSSYGFLLEPELSNLQVVTADVGFSIFDASSIDFVYHWYQQVEPADFLRDANLDTELTGRSRDVGHAIDVVLAVQELSWLEFDMVASAFRTGRSFGPDKHEWVFGGLFGITVVF
jgi:hypothetical protein